MNDLKITCLSIDCPERHGGECNAKVNPDLIIDLFLEESNKIEGVYDEDSLKQAKHAWKYLIAQPKLDGGVILKTHKILMLHQKLLPNQKGYWRRVPVWIGGREALDWHMVPDQIAQWLAIVDGLKTAQFPAEWIKQCHVMYENIHPFVDGNGRTGRMFMNFMRLKAGLPVMVVFEEDKQEYYKWFRT